MPARTTIENADSIHGTTSLHRRDERGLTFGHAPREDFEHSLLLLSTMASWEERLAQWVKVKDRSS